MEIMKKKDGKRIGQKCSVLVLPANSPPTLAYQRPINRLPTAYESPMKWGWIFRLVSVDIFSARDCFGLPVLSVPFRGCSVYPPWM